MAKLWKRGKFALKDWQKRCKHSQAAFTRQTKVGKLVLANSSWCVWTAKKQSANTFLFDANSLETCLPPVFVPFTHTNLGLPTGVCQLKFAVWRPLKVTGKNTKASARARTRNYNFECDWLIELSDNKLSNNKLYNMASRATQSNSVTYACSKSRQCTLTLMAWANRFARIFFFARAAIVSVGKNIQIFRDNNG